VTVGFYPRTGVLPRRCDIGPLARAAPPDEQKTDDTDE
jgi:hypothetical protein